MLSVTESTTLSKSPVYPQSAFLELVHPYIV